MYFISYELAALEICGLFGAALYLFSYVMTALDRLPSNGPAYYWAKLIASALVGVSLMAQFNLATAVIQAFFFLISALGIIRHLHRAKRKPSADTPLQVTLLQASNLPQEPLPDLTPPVVASLRNSG